MPSGGALIPETCFSESLHVPAGVDRWFRGCGSLSRPHVGCWSPSKGQMTSRVGRPKAICGRNSEFLALKWCQRALRCLATCGMSVPWVLSHSLRPIEAVRQGHGAEKGPKRQILVNATSFRACRGDQSPDIENLHKIKRIAF